MISLSIDRTGLSLTALAITDDGRTAGTYVLTRDGWQAGVRQSDNTYAESRWTDGAHLVSTKKNLLTVNLQCRVWGTSVADTYAMADALGAALDQYAYTITETYTGGSAVHTCMPASWGYANDPDDLRVGSLVFTAVIPRQP